MIFFNFSKEISNSLNNNKMANLMSENTQNKKTEIPIPKAPNDPVSQFEAFVDLVKILRAECPWDQKQTNKSIAHLLIEESYETIDAIEQEDDIELSKELGDILLHVVMHSVIADQRNAFSLSDVIAKIHAKMVNRHPHVFGEVEVSGEQEVLNNWEKLKKKEGKKSALEGVPNTLPALLRAERIQHKASRVGFDWDKKEDVWAKVFEELKEFHEELANQNKEKANQEFGDLIFALVNAARFEGIVAEDALQTTNKKFIKRFQYIESKALEMGLDLENMTLAEMDKLWDEAKLVL